MVDWSKQHPIKNENETNRTIKGAFGNVITDSQKNNKCLIENHEKMHQKTENDDHVGWNG